MTASSSFQDAVSAIDRGDLEALRALLAGDPDLLRATAVGEAEPYAGYFHGATLLHHVAGNPVRCPMPPNAVAVAEVLLDAGAEVDAGCGGGPTQPGTGGGTTLGLVMSSGQAAESGQGPALIDLLRARGARVGFDDGGLLWLALYHTVECQAQRDMATYLRSHGAPVDLCLAAALGEMDTVRAYFDTDGSVREDAAAFWKSRRPDGRKPEGPEVLVEALAAASANGRVDVIAYLLDAGAKADVWTRYGSLRVTPFHCAAWAGWTDACALYLQRGVTAQRRDPEHSGTPLGWAAHCGHQACVDLFLAVPERLDVLDLMEYASLPVAQARLSDMDVNGAYGPGDPGVLLRVAAFLGREDLTRWLLEHGADPTLASSEGKTALDVARDRGHHAVVGLLERFAPD